MATFLISIIFALGTLAALWLLAAVLVTLLLGAAFIWFPRFAPPLWLDVTLCIAFMPVLVVECIWVLLGLAGKDKQQAALEGSVIL